MTADEIVWEDPPSINRRSDYTYRGRYASTLDVLREHPGRWARISTSSTKGKASGLANNIRCGAFRAAEPAGAFEAKTRSVDGEYRVYARYVGEPEQISDLAHRVQHGGDIRPNAETAHLRFNEAPYRGAS